MASPTEENYLKALFHLSSDSEEVSVSAISSLLSVSKPSANSMMKNLKEKGLVHYEKYRPLMLTSRGKKEAALIVRKHRLTEMYLSEKMGFSWQEVHEIAEQVEHVDSTKFFERMDEILEHPKEDPHGSPIPDRDGNIIKQPYKSLSNCNSGDHVKLAALGYSSREFLEFLDFRGITLGLLIKIESIEAFDHSMLISYNGKRESLSSQVSDRLLVEIL
jgi:DtxR family Mn-dependent transcriptional regulator